MDNETLKNLKKEARNRFIFAIKQPQDFANAWQNTENTINGGFDNASFDKYKEIIERQALKRFYEEPFPLRETTLSIHAWQVRFLEMALKKCRA